MQDVRLVQVLYRTQQVVNYVLCVLHLQVNIRFDDLFQITFRVFHDHIERVKSGWILGVEQLDQLDDERMLEFAHEGHLSQYSLAVRLILEDILHALDRDLLPRALSRRQCHFAVAACAEQSLTGVIIAHLPVRELVQAQIAPPAPLRRGGCRLRWVRCRCSRLRRCGLPSWLRLSATFDH